LLLIATSKIDAACDDLLTGEVVADELLFVAIAAMTLSLTPSLFSAIRPSGEVS